MRKLAIFGLAIALLTTLGAPVGAKTKAPKERAFYLHFPSEGGTCGSSFMDLQADTPDSGCGYTFQPANEAFHATGAQPVLTRDWPAAEGVPFKVDTKRPVTAMLALNSFLGQPAVGQAVVELKLVGSVKSQTVTLFDESVTLNMAPGAAGSNVAEFEVVLDKSLSGKKFTTLVATTVVRGASNFHYFDLESDPAHITIPTR